MILPGESAIFVSAVANQLRQVARFREHRFDLRFILPVSCKTEHARVVVEMLRDSETGSDDDTRNGWTLEDIAHACVGDAHSMLVGNLLEHGEQFLEECPSAPCVDHGLVFLQRCGVEFTLARFWTSEKFLRKQSSEDVSVCQQCDSVIAAKRRHLHLGPAIHQGILDLIRDDACSLFGNNTQMFGVEICQCEMLDPALVLKVGKMLECVEVAGV